MRTISTRFLLLAVALLPACGDPTPVGIPYTPASLVVRGVVVDTAGRRVANAVVKAWSVVWRSFLPGDGPEPFGACRGRREALTTVVVSDARGTFSAPVEIPGDTRAYCLALQVAPSAEYAALGFTIDSLKLRKHPSWYQVVDSLSVSLVLSAR